MTSLPKGVGKPTRRGGEVDKDVKNILIIDRPTSTLNIFIAEVIVLSDLGAYWLHN